jgi:hypothetical protein
MGAPFPLIDLSLCDGNDYKRPTQRICQVSTTTQVGICIPTIHSAMGNDKGAHYQLEAHGNVVFYPFISRDLPRDSNTQRDEKGDSPRALLYLPRRDNVAVSHRINVAVSHHINVSPSFCNLLQPA